eukprot:CAMPEP_0184500976 /NCGR_PEP_ID=MMETSP0113_2-20130426/46367_1 /TAXON_ID=91329 /ORGANISM="Norrisiella sphaerica, Strain BC52" /LENGTH=1103 /DNA_ID=CAMNT_0026889575 /DNA_START=367 /DNA_END=3678 /DNA_ORIENTATION=-
MNKVLLHSKLPGPTNTKDLATFNTAAPRRKNTRVQGFFADLGQALGVDPADLTIKYYKKRVGEVNRLEDEMRALSNSELRGKTDEFRNRIRAGETEEDLLCEAFAVVREASRRVLGLRPFDSQLIGGMVLNDGKIAEMKTGEGKTLVAALPSYLNALSGKGAHVVTVNDYLAKRDAENIGQIHKALGLSVGIIQSGMTPESRRAAYACDITYATNSEIGFDYLRDNLAQTKDELVMRDFNFCVIDEADSILIDEARTPLIISGPADTPSDRYTTAARLVEVLVKDIHYTIDEKKKEAGLTEEGMDAALEVLQVSSIEDEGWSLFITQALKAKELFQRNKEYIVKNGEIIIVDEFTGRTMPGRRWSGGQHQAIEAKENVEVQRETVTIASITYQNLFRGYNKLSGMTGTGNTEAGEFWKIYDLNVNVVPPNKPNLRKDYPDAVYTSQEYKYESVVREVEQLHRAGRPILVGTTSVESSELLSQMLTASGVKHEVLNARPENIERESEIVAQSGRKGAVTIATNMAGRGTDILLGGNADFMARLKIKEELMPHIVNFNDGIDRIRPLTIDTWRVRTEGIFPCELSDKTKELVKDALHVAVNTWGGSSLTELEAEEKLSEAFENAPLQDKVVQKIREAFRAVESEYKSVTGKEKIEVQQLGGLHVIGTERHESRRIDNQLRGRSGRQGDPGSTRFFLSLDDQLFRVFGGDKIKKFMVQMDIDDRPLESKLVAGSLDDAQEQVESYFFGMRKTLFDYDVVLSSQRQNLYANRKKVLLSPDMSQLMISSAHEMVDDILEAHLNPQTPKNLWIPLLARVGNVLRQFLPSLKDITGKHLWNVCGGNYEKARKYLRMQAVEAYWDKVAKVEELAPGCSDECARYIFLQTLDSKWKTHLQEMDFVKNRAQFQSYAERDPLVEYKLQGSEIYSELIKTLKRDAIFSFYKFNPPPNLAEVLTAGNPRENSEAAKKQAGEMKSEAAGATEAQAEAEATGQVSTETKKEEHVTSAPQSSESESVQETMMAAVKASREMQAKKKKKKKKKTQKVQAADAKQDQADIAASAKAMVAKGVEELRAQFPDMPEAPSKKSGGASAGTASGDLSVEEKQTTR